MKIAVKCKNCKISPQKARLVAREIKGKNISEISVLLSQMNTKGAYFFQKLIRSAIANIEHNHQLDPSDFILKNAMVDKGMVLKRFLPRAKGRSNRLLKRHSSLKLELQDRSI